MREIIFRGKWLDNGEWVEGDLYHRNEEVLINNFYEGFNLAVDPATVGQYTGLKDKNGKRVFEGDIVDFKGSKFVIAWLDKYSRFAGTQPGIVFAGFNLAYCEVIGNIHDHPELLEGGN